MVRFRSVPAKFLIALGLLVGVIVVTRSLWLRAIGEFLIRSEAPVVSDIIVVLGGDFYGHRILKSGELVRQGYAPKALISGPPGVYDYHECDLAIPFAVKRGYPPGYFIPFPHDALSTRAEAQAILPELRRRGVRRFLLVTSNYHSRRASRIFRELGRDLDMRIVSAPDQFFTPGNWWRNREAEKTVFFEWAKTVGAYLGL